MGTLEELAGKLLGGATSGQPSGQAATAQPPQAALEGLLGLINHPSVGGLAGLAQKFQSAGLGHLVSGWISNGPNPAVSADQVQKALGSDQIAAYAQKLGIPPDQAAGIVAKLLAACRRSPDARRQCPRGRHQCAKRNRHAQGEAARLIDAALNVKARTTPRSRRGISCISSRCRTGMDRSGQPSRLRA